VVAGDEDDRHAAVGHREQGLERPDDQAGLDPAAEQQVAAVHHQVDLAAPGRGERAVEVGEEIASAMRTVRTRPRRQVEPEVGVGDEEDADHAGSLRERGTPLSARESPPGAAKAPGDEVLLGAT
jgi:hypothetical protein